MLPRIPRPARLLLASVVFLALASAAGAQQNNRRDDDRNREIREAADKAKEAINRLR